MSPTGDASAMLAPAWPQQLVIGTPHSPQVILKAGAGEVLVATVPGGRRTIQCFWARIEGSVCPEFWELGTLGRQCQIHAFPGGPLGPLSLTVSPPPKEPSGRITYLFVCEKLALFMWSEHICLPFFHLFGQQTFWRLLCASLLLVIPKDLGLQARWEEALA